MKKLSITIFILFITFLVIPLDGFSLKKRDEVRVTEDRVRLRLKPSTQSAIIHHFKANDVVVILQVWKKERIGKFGKHYWYKVIDYSKIDEPRTGWVFGAFLSKVLTKITFKKENNGWLYPIGWSRDGKFAYIHDHHNLLACQGEITLCIRDLSNNKTLYMNYDCHKGFTRYWLKNKSKTLRKFKSLLRKYRIRLSANFLIGHFPIKVKKKRFAVTTKYKVKKTTMYNEDLEYVSQVSVYLKSNKKRKLIYRKTFKDPYQAPYSGTIGFTEGYLKSPYENRIAIIQTGYSTHTDYDDVLVIGTALQ